MPDPGFTRPDLCSIRAAAGQAEPAETARGGLTADGHLPAGDYPSAPLATGIDRAIRLSTAAAVLAVAGIAASPTGTPTQSSGPTARPGSPPGSSPQPSTASSTPARWWSCTRHGTGYRYPPSPAGCSRWESPLPSRRTWHRAGRTVPSGRWSRPGRRSVSWAAMSFLRASSACCMTLHGPVSLQVLRRVSAGVVLVADSSYSSLASDGGGDACVSGEAAVWCAVLDGAR